jgi:hypothetical protein
MTRFVMDRPAALVRERFAGHDWPAATAWHVGYDLRTALGPLRDLEDPAVDRLRPLVVQGALAVIAADAIDVGGRTGEAGRAVRKLARSAATSALRRDVLLALRSGRRLATTGDEPAARALCQALVRLAGSAPGPFARAACDRLVFAVAARYRLREAARSAARRLGRAAAAHGAMRDADRWRRWSV